MLIVGELLFTCLALSVRCCVVLSREVVDSYFISIDVNVDDSEWSWIGFLAKAEVDNRKLDRSKMSSVGCRMDRCWGHFHGETCSQGVLATLYFLILAFISDVLR